MVDEVEVEVFDLSDIAERALSTAVEVAAVGFPALYLALRGPNAKASTIAFGITVGSAALSVVKNAAKTYFNAKKAKVQL